MNKILTNGSSGQSRILDTDFLDRLTLYQSANSSPEVVKRNFLVRIAEFDLIVSALRRKKVADPAQHELILGRRGSGKSTLLRRIQIEIDEDPDLASRYIAINLAEEQAAIYRLSDLWFEVLQELMNRFDNVLELRHFDDFDDNSAYARYLYAEIHRLLQTAGKKAVLLLDNLDRILQNFDDDGNLLREILQNYNDLQIIGGSTRMDEHFWHYDKPFYEFFRRHRLEGLHFEEIHLLLNHWSTEMQLPLLYDYALQHRGRIEAIRILTDGLPRALQFFIQILLHDANQYGFDYLRKIMDRATPLYQERLNNLTASQRKIVQEMAFWWEAAPTKVLVEKCRIEGKTIAALLRQLEQYGIVETIQTGKKNHLYRIAERFFNMWLIVTQGNPDQKRKAKYLTHFLESWYDVTELKTLSEQHLTELKTGKLSYDKASVMSKALSQSKYIGVKERDELIDLTLQLHAADLKDSELPRKYQTIKTEIDKLWEENRYEDALQKIEEIENEDDGVKFFLQAYCYDELKKYKEAERYYLQAIGKGHAIAVNNLAVLYAAQGKNVDAERYYLQAIEKGHVDAMYNLANLYKDQGKYAEAESYYLQAIEKGHVNSVNNLAILYTGQGKSMEAESYYLQAIEKGMVEALYNLAILYKDQGKNADAESYYLQAVEKGYADALHNLAILYKDQGKNAEAENYYLQAIEKGIVDSLNNLATLYNEQGKFIEAERYYLHAIEKDNVPALNNLANFYTEQGKNMEAETYYLKAIEKGHVMALYNLALLYTLHGKNREAESYYLQAIEKGNIKALNNLAVQYYHFKQKPQKALDYIHQYYAQSGNESIYYFVVLIEIWNGIFDGLPEKIARVLDNSAGEDLEWFLTELLCLEQKQLVLALFESEIHGKMLKSRYELIYYAALILSNKTDDSLMLRIPPELLPTVESIVEKVEMEIGIRNGKSSS
jgi:TPR repeat protein